MASIKSRRFLGIELSGAKNHKTTLATLDTYPREGKTFLLDLIDGLGPEEKASGDQVLLRKISDFGSEIASIGVNVPTDFPPCATCTRAKCPLPERCTVPEVKWMRRWGARAKKPITPYTQRPLELWVRNEVLPELDSKSGQLDLDEAFGGTRAPLTARMVFLRRHLKSISIIETSPKVAVALLGKQLKIPLRWLNSYRDLENGAYARGEILEILAQKMNLFIYEKDRKKLAESLGALDAFVCALMAMQSDLGTTMPRPKGLPPKAGWISLPVLKVIPLLFCLWAGGCNLFSDRENPSPKASNLFEIVSGGDSAEPSERWDKYHESWGGVKDRPPTAALQKFVDQLPIGRALVLAMSDGHDAVFLAKKGFQVEGIDISPVAIRKASRAAREQNVVIRAIQADLSKYQIKENYYDVVVNVTYFRQGLIRDVAKSLRPGGVAVFQNFTESQKEKPTGLTLPPKFYVKKGQLREEFSGFEVLEYQEREDPESALAWIVARKKPLGE